MIPLLFYKKFTINSPLSQEEAFQRLAEQVTPTQGFTFNILRREQLFEGLVSKDKFQIARIIWYRNSFLPVVYGRFVPCETGSHIRIFITLHPLILFIVASSGLIAGLSVLFVMHQLVTTGALDDLQKKILLVMGLVYSVCTLAFGLEANIASRMLKRLFEAE